MTSIELLDVVDTFSTRFVQRFFVSYLEFSHAEQLSLIQMQVLDLLHYLGESDISSISHYLKVSPSAASQMVERLHRDGLVLRREGQKDRRNKVIILSEKGSGIIQRRNDHRRAWLTQMLAQIPPSLHPQIINTLQLIQSQFQPNPGDSLS